MVIGSSYETFWLEMYTRSVEHPNRPRHRTFQIGLCGLVVQVVAFAFAVGIRLAVRAVGDRVWFLDLLQLILMLNFLHRWKRRSLHVVRPADAKCASYCSGPSVIRSVLFWMFSRSLERWAEMELCHTEGAYANTDLVVALYKDTK